MKSNSKFGGAEIIFNKSKYALKALDDEETLRNEFYLIVINNHNRNKMEKTTDEKWRDFVNKRQKQFNHEQYQQFVWNKVDQFINENAATNV